jgi:hypothetical protein
MGTVLLAEYSLKFHKRSFKDGSGKCDICIGGPGVYLAIYEVAKSERSTLDRVEGLGYGYNRHEIQLDEFGVCSTYIAAPEAVDETLLPLDWYREYVIIGARFHRFADSYIASIESLRAARDSDSDRAAREWMHVEEIRNDG